MVKFNGFGSLNNCILIWKYGLSKISLGAIILNDVSIFKLTWTNQLYMKCLITAHLIPWRWRKTLFCKVGTVVIFEKFKFNSSSLYFQDAHVSRIDRDHSLDCLNISKVRCLYFRISL